MKTSLITDTSDLTFMPIAELRVPSPGPLLFTLYPQPPADHPAPPGHPQALRAPALQPAPRHQALQTLPHLHILLFHGVIFPSPKASSLSNEPELQDLPDQPEDGDS